jgi:uncharacterized oxidoreductase
MNLKNNTVLITGGATGIGLGLAEEFLKLENQVIIAGRTQSKLDQAASKNNRLKTMTVDMSNYASIKDFASEVIKKYPSLNVVIHSAGVMKAEDLLSEGHQRNENDETIETNFLGPIRLTEMLLPHLRKQPTAAIMTVTSGLAFTPLAMYPTYCATKAAIHSYTQSLRYQLKDTKIEVIELAPPYVATTLTGEAQARDPHAMPLNEFIDETMQLLRNEPNAAEILVKRVHPLRFAEQEHGKNYAQFFKQFNDSMTAARMNRK